MRWAEERNSFVKHPSKSMWRRRDGVHLIPAVDGWAINTPAAFGWSPIACATPDGGTAAEVCALVDEMHPDPVRDHPWPIVNADGQRAPLTYGWICAHYAVVIWRRTDGLYVQPHGGGGWIIWAERLGKDRAFPVVRATPDGAVPVLWPVTYIQEVWAAADEMQPFDPEHSLAAERKKCSW